MLQKFRGRCKFRQYIPSKPGRYGIKYWIIADAENHYCYNAIPYLGKETEFPAVNLGAQVVKSLVEPIKATNKNITCDRYFTSVDLFEELSKINLQLFALSCLIESIYHYSYYLSKPEVEKLDLASLLSKII